MAPRPRQKYPSTTKPETHSRTTVGETFIVIRPLCHNKKRRVRHCAAVKSVIGRRLGKLVARYRSIRGIDMEIAAEVLTSFTCAGNGRDAPQRTINSSSDQQSSPKRAHVERSNETELSHCWRERGLLRS